MTGLTDGTYYWQVRATLPGGSQALADNGTWWTARASASEPARTERFDGVPARERVRGPAGTKSPRLKIDAPDPIREYIYAGGQLLASLTLTTGTPVLTYDHTDVLGPVRAVRSATGAPLARHDHQPFGESASATDFGRKPAFDTRSELPRP